MTYSIGCPEYFNLSSNPATSFFSLFTLLMRGLNEDNTAGLCFEMAGGHGFKARLAQRERQPPQLPLISVQDLCRAAEGISFPNICPVPAGAEGFTLQYRLPAPQPGSAESSVLMFASSAWHLGRRGSKCFGRAAAAAAGKEMAANRLAQSAWAVTCSWAPLVSHEYLLWAKNGCSSPRKYFLHHTASYCIFPGRAICTNIRQMLICINESMKVILHLFLMCWCEFILLHGKSLGSVGSCVSSLCFVLLAQETLLSPKGKLAVGKLQGS